MQSHTGKLVNIAGLSEHKGIPVRTIRTLVATRKIPYLKLGHRLLFFDPQKVDQALQRFEIRAVGSVSVNGRRL
jgi:hypothetical protein